MATKKKKEDAKPDYSATDDAVMRDDTLTIEDVKDFVTKARKKKQNWQDIADRSWREIKKRNTFGGLYGGSVIDTNRARRWTKFPLWWSCWQIRQPMTLARLAIPVLKDTQGDDPFGRTACIIGERLTRGILKTFDAFPEFSASNDDFLITNLGWGRVFYRNEMCEEEEKLRLQEAPQPPQQDPNTPPPPIFITPDGQPVDQPEFDDLGPYVLTGKNVSIENEEVYFEAGLYSNLYTDADARRWNKVTRLAFESSYSYREFKKKFGDVGLAKICKSDVDDHKDGKPIITFEYHDKFLREVRWFAETSEDFFQPTEMANINDLEEVDEPESEKRTEEADGNLDNSDLYGLTGFFPCSAPLIINQSTDEFWPTPEYFQIMDITDDVNSIVTRMILLTKAIRCRFFFDASFPILQQLVSETGEGGGIGVPDLERILINNKGNLSTLVAYLPVDQMIEGLKNMYEAFQQRLEMFYNITGISDLIRGQTPQDGTQKTNGEKQLEAKFAVNRFEPYQRKVQEWIKDNYQLLMELALKMFSDQSLDEYITPQTLDKEDQQRYVAALELLRNNKRRRFRVDFETDSTIAINEQWKKKQAIELANTLTKALESTANIAEQHPELAATELKVLKHMIGEFSDGKLFIDEIQDSIEEVIQKVSQPKTPDFNKDQADNELKQHELEINAQKDQYEFSMDDRFRNFELQTKSQIEMAKLNQKANKEHIDQQVAQLQIQIDQGASQEDMRLAVTKLQADIAQGWEDLNIKKATLLQLAQAAGGKAQLEEFQAIIDQRVKGQEISLAEGQQAIDKFRVQMEAMDYHASLQERIATEQRLQQEDGRIEVEHQMAQQAHVADMITQLSEPPKAAPVSIDASKNVHIKLPNPPAKTKPKAKK